MSAKNSTEKRLRLFSPSEAPSAQQSVSTVADVLQKYQRYLRRRIEAGDYSQGAFDRIARYLESFDEDAGHVPIAECKQHVFTDWWMDHFARWPSDYSKRDAKDAVLGAFRWAEEEEYIERTPFRRPRFRLVITPREPFLLIHYLALMWEATTSKKPRPKRNDLAPFRRRRRHGSLRLREAIFFLMHTGARPSEMRESEWKDLDVESGVIRLYRHKTARTTGKVRVIGLPMKVVRLLATIKRNRTPGQRDKIFINRYGTAWDRNTFARHFRRHAAKAGLERKLTGYCLRHGFISQAIENGVGERQIADQVGHETTRMISHYARSTRRNAAHLRKVAEDSTRRIKCRPR